MFKKVWSLGIMILSAELSSFLYELIVAVEVVVVR